MANYRVLLYYKYIEIDNVEEMAESHLAYCQELGVKGRILIAPEGINGTLSGTIEQTEQYMQYMHTHPLFHDMPFKIENHHQHAFKRLSVRPRNEIVTWRLENEIKPYEKTGKHLSPKEFYEQLQQEDVIVIDGRNDYEYDLGHFRGAIRPEVENTREFPEWIRKNFHDAKDKKIITYCTGGIRCEKLTAFMIEEGFKDVSQLDGGIISYGQDPEIKGRLFDGKCYVFDERISVSVNQQDEVIVGRCYHCDQPAETYVNCTYDFCHRQHIVCPTCSKQHRHFCSEACEENEMRMHVANHHQS